MSWNRVAGIAADFWNRVGSTPGFPRNLDDAIPLALPAIVVSAPHVTVRAMTEFLESYAPDIAVPADADGAMGYTIALHGQVFLFVSDEDGPEERRFTLAHELGHALWHYFIPRDRIVASLGPAAAQVLDGTRESTVAETAASVLAGVHFGAYEHILPRVRSDVDRQESDVDKLAVELVAPQAAIAEIISASEWRQTPRLGRAQLLAARFGIPASHFDRVLGYDLPEGRDFVAGLARAVRTRS